MKASHSASLLLLALGVVSLRGATSPEIAALRVENQTAMSRAAIPVYTNYLRQLQALKQSLTRAGKPDAALAVESEIKNITNDLSDAQKDLSPPPAATAATATVPVVPAAPAAPVPALPAQPDEAAEVLGKWVFHTGLHAPVPWEFKADGTALGEGGLAGKWTIQNHTLSLRYTGGTAQFDLPVENHRLRGRAASGQAVIADKP